MEQIQLKRIKSFVLRQGRMTSGQQLAYDRLWHKYGLGKKLAENTNNYDSLPVLDFEKIFNNKNPINLEIGFGMGDSLAEMASHWTDSNFLGIEVHTPGVGRILQRIDELNLDNLRIFHADAINILEQQIPLSSLNAVYLYFPDPWHKRRHRKRRIVSRHFIELVYSRLIEGGLFHLATDIEDYASAMLKNINQSIEQSRQDSNKMNINFVNQSDNNTYIDRPDWRPKTKFENKGLKKGHGIWDILYKKECS